ncbi:MAG: hypothetical protein ACRDQ7_23685 [Haloechinothrix sp.]
MELLLISLAVLACPVGMGVMMWMMMRGNKQKDSSSAPPKATGTDAELAQLRAELDQLKAERGQRRARTGDS